MLGLRDLVLIAPSPSFHQQNQPISSDNHSNLPLPSSAALSVGLGIFPLLAATPCVPAQQQSNGLEEYGGNSNNPSFWNLKMYPELNSGKKTMVNLEDENGKQLEESEEIGIGESDFRACKDCGNRAKKGCSFKRCRTCCKGRGFDCTTHVKSTWVPAARRRERQMMVVGSGSAGAGTSSGSSSGAKRPRVLLPSHNVTATSHTSTSNATTPRSFDTSSCHQDASFKKSLPGQVRAPAVFRCHRVTAIGNGENEFAYMATVHISGHVFKGFLYDHGVDERNVLPYVTQLNLENHSRGKNVDSSSSPIVVPTNACPASAS
ncbi:protein LATERAL ROOT PRIMORDIUM 1 [Quillaja saponaria]|uniref:Protein LATERAL ROOT PRIMORDIUM 1 n=1 Tax=Quillaja saponaria TaxID=32244 RepID=A0AAD7PC42_QUISA|nr:protein LATERAL ROOT PRIMORDIUM 1 [Quillaja saponaria]KAJ7957734.1 protein LATERAL ROOT PRIMORDIUM 1 [Quillaja saponaria]